LSGDQPGVYLWSQAAPCCGARSALVAAPVWLITGKESAPLPTAPARLPGYVQAYVRTFPDRPVFLVYDAPAQPPAIPGLSITPAQRFAGSLPHWDESSITRPASARQLPFDFTVYRVQPGS